MDDILRRHRPRPEARRFDFGQIAVGWHDCALLRAAYLTIQRFWDQMNAVPVKQLALLEQELVSHVVDTGPLPIQALACDTTNFSFGKWA